MKLMIVINYFCFDMCFSMLFIFLTCHLALIIAPLASTGEFTAVNFGLPLRDSVSTGFVLILNDCYFRPYIYIARKRVGYLTP